MSCSRFFVACLVTLSLAAGCDNNTNIGPLVPFSRPEHVAFACYAQESKSAAWKVLPQACCTNSVEETYSREICGLGKVDASGKSDGTETLQPAHLHALVTQSTRGEVAAVDMTLRASDRVLDSDSLIPGYTFLDSGGLPSAVVVPPKQPGVTGKDQGAKYTFVASAEQFEVRAIPSCRFRFGRACGPELDDRSDDDRNLSARLTVPLPGAPGDMILGPDDRLWVTLPDLKLLASIQLADSKTPNDAFALDLEGHPRVPTFYRVSETDVGKPIFPVDEATTFGEYRETCGLTKIYQPESLALRPEGFTPTIAPRANWADIRPKLLRYDATSDKGGVLLVADAAAPVIHAFTLTKEGVLTARPGLPTGAPLRDLALTKPVPVAVPRVDPGKDQSAPAALRPADLDALPATRYVYAIDDRDGSVMVFKYELLADGAPKLTPLLAPAATQRFADRIDTALPANALDIVDTRTSRPFACNAPFDPATVAAKRADESQEDYDKRVSAAPGDYEAEMVAIRDSASPSSLRGVFVAVVAESGTITMLDVHDLDLACRAAKDCDYVKSNPVAPLRPDARAAVAVRRHSARRLSAGPLIGATTNDPLFEDVTEESCKPFDTAAVTKKLCAPTDPWYTLADTYAVQFQASLPGATSPSGTLSANDGTTPLPENQVLLKAPLELDLCGRGVQVDDRVALTYPLTNVRKRAQNDSCSDVGGESDSAHLFVQKVYRDRLVLRLPEGTTRKRLGECFPDFVNFDVRAGGFLVLGSNYFNDMVVNQTDDKKIVESQPADACVVDPQRKLLRSRAVPGEPFVNPYISFKLNANATTLNSKSATVTLSQGSTLLSTTLVTGTFTDVQPATVRYYAGLNRFFVVDSASTGLSRFGLSPLARED